MLVRHTSHQLRAVEQQKLAHFTTRSKSQLMGVEKRFLPSNIIFWDSFDQLFPMPRLVSGPPSSTSSHGLDPTREKTYTEPFPLW